jgi:hypothetical protein
MLQLKQHKLLNPPTNHSDAQIPMQKQHGYKNKTMNMVSSKVNNSIIAGVNHNEMDEIPKNSKEWL